MSIMTLRSLTTTHVESICTILNAAEEVEFLTTWNDGETHVAVEYRGTLALSMLIDDGVVLVQNCNIRVTDLDMRKMPQLSNLLKSWLNTELEALMDSLREEDRGV